MNAGIGMTASNRIFALLVALAGFASVFLWWQVPTTVLPSGLVLRGDDLFAKEGATLLATDIEFLCFDDRYVIVGTRRGGPGGIFDKDGNAQMSLESRPEIFMPGGLKFGRRACNGYYTSMVGPRLLVAGNRPPFLPNCTSVNRENAALKDQSWLNRPCAGP